MKTKTLNLFTLSFILNLLAFIGLLLNSNLFRSVFIAVLVVIFWLAGLLTTLYVSLLIGRVSFEKEEVLDEEIKKTRDRYKDNELFIKALKNIITRKEIPLKEIEIEKQKLKK